MIAINFQSIAEVAAAGATNTMLEGFGLAGLSWLALRCFAGRNSTTRFAVWFSTLLAVASLPFLNWKTSLISRVSQSSVSRHSPELMLSSSWALYLFVGWALISGILIVRLCLSLVHIYRLRKSSRQIDVSHPILGQAGPCGGRKVQFLESESVRVPAAIGFFRPAVVLPSWTLRELSQDELRAIVLHELAHLRRWDDWTNLTQKFLKALFFFHPAVWWIDARLAIEREMACDDLVLAQAANAHGYARSLISVAEKAIAERARMARALALAQGALGRAREISRRVAQILDGRSRADRGWRPAAGIISSVAVVAVAGMQFAPELVSFQAKQAPLTQQQAVSVNSRGSNPMVIPAQWTEKPKGNSGVIVATAPKSNHVDGYRPGKQLADREYVSAEEAHTQVIPAKATLRKQNRKVKVMVAKADEGGNQPKKTLLVMHSTQTDSEGTPLWTLSVWRFTSPDGRMVQEMIVMNSI